MELRMLMSHHHLRFCFFRWRHPAQRHLQHDIRLRRWHGYMTLLCIPLSCISELFFHYIRRLKIIWLARLYQYFISLLNLLARESITRHPWMTRLWVEVMRINLLLWRSCKQSLHGICSSLATADLIHIVLNSVIISPLCEGHIGLALIHNHWAILSWKLLILSFWAVLFFNFLRGWVWITCWQTREL